MEPRRLADTPLRRGDSGSTATRTRYATGEALLLPAPKRRNKVDRIIGAPGKSAEGERVAEGSVRVRTRSNVRRAKGPCCLCSSDNMGRQGRDDKGAHQSARPATEDIPQGEG